MMRFLAFAFVFCLSTTVFSQEIGYGFKAGLNFNSFNSDSEQDASGKDLESFTGNTGFHVGAIFTWKATELMGLRAELLFSQKGGRQRFEGPSYYQFISTDSLTLEVPGKRDMRLNVTNAYIDIPVMGYYRPLQWLELFAGGNIGFLVSSAAVGDLKYTPDDTSIPAVDYSLDFNYYTDDPGGVTPSGEFIQINNNFEVATLDRAGAYAEFDKDRGNLFKTVDLGLIGGLSLYFNKGLFISGRVNYGLSDITKNKADVSLVKKDANGQFISQEQKDRNFSIQASIGFSF
ncbi:MAG: porin family protein [Saprospiraceae bacterium]